MLCNYVGLWNIELLEKSLYVYNSLTLQTNAHSETPDEKNGWYADFTLIRLSRLGYELKRR